MWCSTFEQRLAAWNSLRDRVRDLPMEEALEQINAWWQRSPWRAYHLHWDDRTDWPDPWQLLSDNIYCDLARGLGILYTITVLDRDDIQDAELIETEHGNLVQVAGGKYILNWGTELELNTRLQHSKHHIAQREVKQQLY
jgi:hypothetical protein